MDTETNDSLLEEFVLESREHLGTIEEDILSIEKGKKNPDLELINKVFRSVHSIKGLAGFFGMENINKLTHLMETILSMIRNGDIMPELRIVDPLLKGVDAVNTMLNNVKNSNEFDISDIHDVLNNLLLNEAPPHILNAVKSSKNLIDINGNLVDFTLDEFTLGNIPENENLYELKYNLVDIYNRTNNSPIKLIRLLKEKGTVVNGKIKFDYEDLADGLPKGPFECHLLYSTKVDDKNIDAITMLSNSNIVKINKNFVNKQPGDSEITLDDKKKVNYVEKQEKKVEIEKPAILKNNKSSIRINVDILDKLMTLAGELVLVRNQQLLKIDNSDIITRGEVQHLDSVTAELQETIMRTRMQPIGNVFSKFTRIVRDLGNKLNKEIKLSIIGNEVELDKTILESLADPLTHLIRNSCDHGVELPNDRLKLGKPEIGNLNLKAYHEGGQINIVLSDDGKGINIESVKNKILEKKIKSEDELALMNEKEILQIIMIPGFSTAESISQVSGRGVGMDVVKSNIDKLGGTIDIVTKFNKGTTVHLRLPLTLTIIPCLIIKVDDNRYAIPQVNIVELLALYDNDINTKIECAGDKEVYRLRNKLLPIVRLNEVLSRAEPFTNDTWAEIVDKYHMDDNNKGITSYDKNSEVTIGNSVNQQIEINKTWNSKESKKSKSLTFVVLRVGKSSIGLIIDQVIGTEEIVVKPMHSSLKYLSCFSGATIMGDGKVALILDVDGVRKHAEIELNNDDKIIEKNEKVYENDLHTILLFNNGEEEQFAVALPLIKRIEKIKLSNIERVGEKEFITIDSVSTIIIRLDHYLNVSKCIEKTEMYLLLPKYTKTPFGILVSNIVDIKETTMNIHQKSYKEDGLLGTDIVEGKMTIFIDIYRIIEKASKLFIRQNGNGRKLPTIRKRGLLVEDMSFFRELIKGYLESDGYEVVTAENGNGAVDRINESKFDFLISDLDMPIMDGFDFIKAVREKSNVKNIPAIALTASDNEESKLQAMNCGFDRYEVKLDREHFLSTVSDVLKGYESGV